MKIERVDLIQIRMRLKAPFETSYGRQSELDKLIIKVYTHDETAYSECTVGNQPLDSYETLETAKYILKSFIIPSIMGSELRGPDHYWEKIARFRGHPMAKAAMENAIWTLKAMEEGIPLAKCLGGQRDKILSGVSIGIQNSTEELIERIASYLSQGYPKVKIKIKPGKDVNTIEEVRHHFPDITLMVDANNAFSLNHMETLEAMDQFNLLMIEQPLGHDDMVDHSRLQAKLETPICLDESINSPSAARVAAALHACRIINIKQGRVGGLTQALEVHNIAQANGMGVWCGGMLETGIGRAVNVAIATLPNFIYPSDISASDRYWERDLIDPPFAINPDGTIDVPSEPGLGVKVNEAVLDRFTVEQEIIR
jgi:o-succinylbenzoate synthase